MSYDLKNINTVGPQLQGLHRVDSDLINYLLN